MSATWDPFSEPAGPAPAPQQQAQDERTEMARLAQATFASPAGQGFLAMLRAELEGLAPWLGERRARAHVVLADEFQPVKAAAAIQRLAGQCDAAVLMCQDHPLVRHAIEELAAITSPSGRR
jgi:uncharacterized protein with von Willebrand factor type A (vWA) domain